MKEFSFEIEHALGHERFARAGVIHTPHGDIRTPAFIPVGTQAAIKALTVDHMHDLGAQALLANAYHLYEQPGHELIEKAGGLSRFMNWPGPTFTDSGGFQVLSLGSGYKKVISLQADDAAVVERSTRRAFVNEDGVTFKSARDGSIHQFTPELSMRIQHGIGADISFAFDELTSLAEPYEYQVESLARTHAWAERSLTEFRRLSGTTSERPYQALFGVLQGANFEDLRRQTAKKLGSMDFDGYGIGGALEKTRLEEIIRWCTEELPVLAPKHLLGISEPDDIFAGVAVGMDTFDCVSPTRVARNGSAYTRDGRFNIKAGKWRDSFTPLDPDCECFVCRQYTRAYLTHLYKSKEILAAILVSYHNEYFIVKLVESMRAAIVDGTFDRLRCDWLARYYKK